MANEYLKRDKIQVLLNANEQEILKEASQVEGRSRSSFIRHSALKRAKAVLQNE